jgi:hypothetical protein
VGENGEKRWGGKGRTKGLEEDFLSELRVSVTLEEAQLSQSGSGRSVWWDLSDSRLLMSGEGSW